MTNCVPDCTINDLFILIYSPTQILIQNFTKLDLQKLGKWRNLRNNFNFPGRTALPICYDNMNILNTLVQIMVLVCSLPLLRLLCWQFCIFLWQVFRFTFLVLLSRSHWFNIFIFIRGRGIAHRSVFIRAKYQILDNIFLQSYIFLLLLFLLLLLLLFRRFISANK